MINIDTMAPVPEFDAESQGAKAPQGFLRRLATKIAAFFSEHNAVAAAPSPERESNRILAGEILEHVKKTVLFSSNYPERSPVVEAEDDPDAYQHRFDAIRIMVDEVQNHPKIRQDHLENWVLDRAYYAEKYSVGNCGEMTCVGFKYAMEKGVAQKVSYWRIVNGDHGFLVIGEGKDAYICDPWASRCYPFSQHKEHLKDYVETCQLSTGQIVVGVRDFQPKKQSLKAVLTYPGKKPEAPKSAPQTPPQKPSTCYQTLLRYHKF
jgi:hypothetical protein